MFVAFLQSYYILLLRLSAGQDGEQGLLASDVHGEPVQATCHIRYYQSYSDFAKLNDYTDSQVADQLNQLGLRSGKGQPFNAIIVTHLRKAYGLTGPTPVCEGAAH